MNRNHFLRIALVCLAAAGLLCGSGGAPASLNQLIAASDHIVVGHIVSGSVSGPVFVLSIEVERTLKGTLSAGATVQAAGRFSESSPAGDLARDVPHEWGLFFLSDAGGGALRLVPVWNGYLPDERTSFLPLADSPIPAAQAAVNSGLKERILLEVLGGGFKSLKPGGTIDVFGEYNSDPSPLVRSLFRQWMLGNSPELFRLSARALLAEGDIAALARIAADPGNADSAVCEAMRSYFRNPDPAAVAMLGKLADDPSNTPELRTASASALAWIHTGQALPYLAPLLDDANPDVRGAAVGGLAMFANNVISGEGSPSAVAWKYRTEETIAHSCMGPTCMKQNEGYYIGFWKTWWTANRNSIEAGLATAP